MITNGNGWMGPQTQPSSNGPLVQQAPRPQPQAPSYGGIGGSDTRQRLTQAIMQAMQQKAQQDLANNPSPWTAMGNAATQVAAAYAQHRANNNQNVLQKVKSKMPPMGIPKINKIPGG